MEEKELNLEENKPFVSLKKVNKYYDNGMHAVVDFDLDIKKHEFIVFVGPSGCGKSTTLRMIAGLEDISSGELYIGDKLANDLEPIDRDVAMVFQSYALYPNMTIYDNMAFTLQVHHMPKDEIDRRVKEAAEILEISDQLFKKPKALSGGQRQRVALGRAIVRNADIFLMDEPLSNLDAKLRVYMRSEIVKLHERMNATTIYVTHDQTEAMTMADRIVVMKNGYVQQIGSPEEIYKNPSNMFVASFIGSPAMNFVDVSFKNNKLIFLDGNEISVDKDLSNKINNFYKSLLEEEENGFDEFLANREKEALAEFKNKKSLFKKKFSFNSEKDPKVLAKKEKIERIKVAIEEEEKHLIFGIRPEAIKDDLKNGKEYVAEFVELLGDQYYVHFQFGGKKCLAKISADVKVEKGSHIKLAVQENKMHIFDPISEKAII